MDESTARTPGRTTPSWSPSPLLGRVLNAGSRLSMVLVVIGLIIALIQGSHGGTTLKPNALLQALEHGRGTGVLGLGLGVLIITPIAREAVALVLFLRHQERSMVLLAAIVLAMVALSLAIGAR